MTIGVIIGLGTALLAMRVLSALVFDVSPLDPASFAIAALVLVATALCASYIPARRATRIYQRASSSCPTSLETDHEHPHHHRHRCAAGTAMEKLTHLTVSGFRSLRSLDTPLGDLTVLIGANGSGKSNLVALFDMLSFMLSGSLQLYIGRKGGGSSILHYGPKTTPVLFTQVLRPHLARFRVYATPELLAKSGGYVPYGRLRSSIKREVGRSRAHEHVTTMIDLYALPADYPGKERCAGESGAERATRIEAGMAEGLPNPRFIPYVQVHEFEALVLVDVDQIPSQFPDGEAVGAPERLRRSIGQLGPEEVDDGGETAPSKRIVREIPAYANLKPIAGPAIAQRIGLPRLRETCPHFDQWIGRLEQLAQP